MRYSSISHILIHTRKTRTTAFIYKHSLSCIKTSGYRTFADIFFLSYYLSLVASCLTGLLKTKLLGNGNLLCGSTLYLKFDISLKVKLAFA